MPHLTLYLPQKAQALIPLLYNIRRQVIPELCLPDKHSDAGPRKLRVVWQARSGAFGVDLSPFKPSPQNGVARG
jgi:hypothetical protein